jgi:HUS1 checkpoint protein
LGIILFIYSSSEPHTQKQKMRFKAKLAPEQVSLFHSIIVPMTRLNSASSGSNSNGDTTGNSRTYSSSSGVLSSFTRNGTILYFDNDHVRISCRGNKSHQEMDGITCFVELNAKGYSSIFLDRRIESVAPNNAIIMEIDLTQLRIAMKSVIGDSIGTDQKLHSTVIVDGDIVDAQRYAVIKLAKRQNIPCLCIDACSVGGSGKGSNGSIIGNNCMIQVHHAIPVRILRHTEMQHHLPPPIQQLPNVQLELHGPSALNLRTVIDRLKYISSIIYLEANMKGELTISAHTDGASIQTFFSKLVPRFDDCQQRPNDIDLSKKTRIKIDTKKLAASLLWQQHQSQMVSSALLCLVENEMVVIHANLNPENVGFFTYYVPVHYLSKDPYDD